MKILTNVCFSKLAGINQTMSSLVAHVQNCGDSKKLDIVGIEMEKSGDPCFPAKIREIREGNSKIITVSMHHPDVNELVDKSENIGNVEKAMGPLIDQYRKIIKSEKPDVVLLNGTYYLPWCLFLAAKNFAQKIVLHYHGSLTKETEHYPQAMRKIFNKMEKTFDSDNLRYIFPSLLAKNTIAKEVFNREPKYFCVLPNPIPLHFFETVKKRSNPIKSVGAVARWRHIKNSDFIEKFASYNSNLIKRFAFNLLTDMRTVVNFPDHIRRIAKLIKPMDNSRLGRFYSKMDVMICPSHFETYGNVAQESLASGIPALVSSNMGIAEIFRRFGLEKWITKFDCPADVFKKIEQTLGERVDVKLRSELKNELNPKKIHSRLLDYIRGV